MTLPFFERKGFVATVLVLLNVVGVMLGYGMTVLVARSLGHDGFQQYVGAIATLGLLASIGEGGFGKFGLQAVPVFIDQKRRDLLYGYLRFALVGCFAWTVCWGVGAGLIEVVLRDGRPERVMLLALVFLPAMALGGIAIDLLLAFRLPIVATMLARLLIPATSLLGLGSVVVFGRLNAMTALTCFGMGSLVGCAVAIVICGRIARREIGSNHPESDTAEWLRQGTAFFAFGFVNAWFFKATLFLLHHIPGQGDNLVMLAPAFDTGCLILLLSKSTDKFFQPSLALIVDRRDWHQGQLLRRQRFAVIGVGIAIFLIVVFAFGERILGLYGNGFSGAYQSLRVIAIGACVWTMFSMAPTYLLFVGRRKSLFLCLFGHAIMLAIATIVLASWYGHFGAAVAFAVSISSLSLCSLSMAQQDFGRSDRPSPQLS